jgi:integrase/recombinase XerC
MDYAVAFLNFLKFEKRYSKYTVEAYEMDLAQYFEYCNQQHTNAIEATARVVRGWVVFLLESGIANRSVNRKISSLKTFYKFLFREGYIQVNPLVKIESLKNRKTLPSFLTENQVNQVLDELQFTDDYAGKRDRLIIEIFYHTGIRLSELINIRIQDIDISNQTLKVLGKRNKERIIPITQSLQKSISAYMVFRNEIEGADAYLLLTNGGEKLYPVFVYNVVKQVLSLVTTQEKRSPHVLRHTFATHLLNNGAEINAIKELLGHSSLAATQVYTHNSFEKLKRIYKQAHPRA